MLDGVRECALILGSYATSLVAHNFAIRIQKFLQNFNILVVYIFYIVGGKIILFHIKMECLQD